MRHYFSTYLLFAAEDSAARAGEIEAAHAGRSRFDAYLGAGVFATRIGSMEVAVAVAALAVSVMALLFTIGSTNHR